MRAILHRRAVGFTLVEIMIVVAIIALIAAIAIPNLLRARHNANEVAAIGNMKTIVDILEEFRANQSPTTYPGAGVLSGGLAAATLPNLAVLVPPYLDTTLAGGVRQGYAFTYTPGAVLVVNVTTGPGVVVPFNTYNTYTLTVTPNAIGVSGTRSFFVNQDGVLRGNAVGAAPTLANTIPIE